MTQFQPGLCNAVRGGWIAGGVIVALLAGTAILRLGKTDAEAAVPTDAAPAPSAPANAPPSQPPRIAQSREGAQLPPGMTPAQFREQRRARQVAEAERKLEGFSNTFQAERRNAAWAARAEATLSGASTSDEIAAFEASPRNFTADCRSSTCRIGADFANTGAIDDWLPLFANSMGGQMKELHYRRVLQPDGSFKLEAYARMDP